MALTYDFDMFAIIPEDVQSEFGDMFNDLGVTGMMGEKMAMFRDPETVAALGRADEAVRTYFTDSGFGMQVYSSGAPAGRYPAADEEARVVVIKKLTANLKTHDLKGANWGGFEFPKFMEALAITAPLDDDALRAPTPGAQQQQTGPTRQTDADRMRRLIALGGLSVGIILLLYVAVQVVP